MARGIVLFILSILLPAQAETAETATILSVVFEGNRAIDSALLQSRLGHSRPGAAYRPEILKYELGTIERIYEDDGFLRVSIGQPVVEVTEVPGKGKAASIRIPISEGSRYTLRSLEIRNATALSATTLLQMCPVAIGQPYGRRRIQVWVDKIISAYHELGYVRSDVRLQESIDDLAHTVGGVVECSEGAVYNVRRIAIANLAGPGAQEFRRRLLVGEGMVYNPEMLVLSLQLLNSMGIYRPLSEEDVKVTIDDGEQAVDLEFKPVPLRSPARNPQD